MADDRRTSGSDRPQRSGGSNFKGSKGGPRSNGDRKFGSERKPFKSDGPRREFKPRDGERRGGGFQKRDDEQRREFKPRDGEQRREFKPRDGEQRREFKPRDGERRGGGFQKRDGERREFKPRDGERREFKPRDGERREFKPRDGERRGGGFQKRDGERRGGRDAQRSGYGDAGRTQQDDVFANRGDQRSANRPDRPKSPDIDEDVTGKELDRIARAELRYLADPNATWVSKHLVMAGRLVDIDPELAYEHALAASRRGGRIGVVREAVGLTAYAAGHFADALREFRTFRRISGSSVHLPLMADCERGLGRPEKALELARSEEAETLDTPLKVEMAIVASGAQADLGNNEAALAELEIPQLDMNRAYSFSPRLFAVYAEALEELGRDDEAAAWRSRVAVAERALGIGDYADPEILDLDDEEADDRPKPRVKDILSEDETNTSRTSFNATEAEEGSVDGTSEDQGIDEEDGLNEVPEADEADSDRAADTTEADDIR